MKNKGFTLIELLAVIVILAIIALIAVPIILNIIGDTKKSADERSAELYLDAVEKAIARYNLKGEFPSSTVCSVVNDGIDCTGVEGTIAVDMDGTKPQVGGTIVIENGRIKTISGLIVGDSKFKKTGFNTQLEIDTSTSNPSEEDNILVGKAFKWMTYYYDDEIEERTESDYTEEEVTLLEFTDSNTVNFSPSILNAGENDVVCSYTYENSVLSIDCGDEYQFDNINLVATSNNLALVFDFTYVTEYEGEPFIDEYGTLAITTNGGVDFAPLTNKDFVKSDDSEIVVSFKLDSTTNYSYGLDRRNVGESNEKVKSKYQYLIIDDNYYEDGYYNEEVVLEKDQNGNYTSITISDKGEDTVYNLVQ